MKRVRIVRATVRPLTAIYCVTIRLFVDGRKIREWQPGHVERPRQTFELVPCVSLASRRTVARDLTRNGIDRRLLLMRRVQTRLEHARRHAASGIAHAAASLRRLSSPDHRRLPPRSS